MANYEGECVRLTKIKAVLFDLNGTLAYARGGAAHRGVPEYLAGRGYEASPQQLEAAWSYVAFIDYAKYGYKSWRSYVSRVLWRLELDVDEEALKGLISLLESKPYRLYDDARTAVPAAKRGGFKTAVVTTIAYFRFKDALKPVRKHLDLVMTGYEAGCDKSNPRMYQKVLQTLNVKPQEAIMIGDELELDVLLPKRLGINAILLDREGKKKRELVDTSVYSLDEAIETIINGQTRTGRSH